MPRERVHLLNVSDLTSLALSGLSLEAVTLTLTNGRALIVSPDEVAALEERAGATTRVHLRGYNRNFNVEGTPSQIVGMFLASQPGP